MSSIPFREFSRAMQDWLAGRDPAVGKVVRPSTWKPILNSAEETPRGLRFSGGAIAVILDGGEDSEVLAQVAEPLATDLNEQFGGAPVADDRREAEAGESAPTAPHHQDDPVTVEPEAAEDLSTLLLPDYDFSREDLDPLGQVTISRAGGVLHYSWPDAGEGEVYRVLTSDMEEPFTPSDIEFTQVALTREPHAQDPEPLTTAVRFVSVWGYHDLGGPVMGQPRRVATGVHVPPLQDFRLEVVDAEGAVFAQWTRPVAPPHVEVSVVTARLPFDAVLGKVLRTGAWMSHEIPNSGTGFQDTSLEGGRRHVYVAAVRAGVDGQQRMSAVEVRDVTPAMVPDPIRDLEIESFTLEGRERLRLTWTQRPGTRVEMYRTPHAPDPAAVSRGALPAEALPGADLPEPARLRNSPEPTGAVTEDGRQQWVMEGVSWDESTDWDSLHITPVTYITERDVVIGRPVQRRRAGRIREVTLIQRMSWQLVTFAWPGAAATVELRMGGVHDEFDPSAPPYLTIERREYERSGGFVIEGGLPPYGCRLFLRALTYLDGKKVVSEPTVAAVDPLWGFDYQVHWPGGAGEKKGLIAGLRTKTASMLGNTVAELRITARAGQVPPSEAPRLRLVHNPHRLPLNAQDGNVVPMLMSKPGGGAPPEETPVLTAPTSGSATVWFDAAEISGFVRLLVDAPPAASVPPEQRRTALERYALADPPLSILWR